MRASHRAALFALALAGAACGPRQAEVRTAPSATGEQSVQVTNNLSQAVNVYVTPSGGGGLFLPPVAADTLEEGAVPGVASRNSVELQALTGDRARAESYKAGEAHAPDGS